MPALGDSLKNYSTTPASNSPQGTDVPSTLDDSIRAVAAGLRDLAARSTVASATTCDIGADDAGFLTISGTTTITGFGTVSEGIYKWLTFSGVLILTHNASSLILPSAANITTQAGDCACLLSLGSGNWRCVSYLRADGTPIALGGYLPNGSAAAPSLALLNSTNTGLYRVADDDLGISTDGTLRVDISTTKVTSTLPIILPTGSSSLPSISRNINGSNDPGMYFSGNAVLLQSDGSTTTVTVDGSGSSEGMKIAKNGTTPLLTLAGSGSFAPDASLEIEFEQAATTSSNAITITADITGTPNLIWRVRNDGSTFADGAYTGSGADYAEAFLFTGPQPQPGDTVTLVGDRVRIAELGDEVIGAVSMWACAIGDGQLLEQGGIAIGLVGKLRVRKGAPVAPQWRLLKPGITDDLYLVR